MRCPICKCKLRPYKTEQTDGANYSCWECKNRFRIEIKKKEME